MTPSTDLGLGRVQPLVRRLSGAPDPLALFETLAGPETPHTFLLESADRGARDGARSLLGVGSALHLTADLEGVTVRALSANGRAALQWILTRLPSAERAAPDRVRVPIDRRPGRCVDERARFRQPSPLDLLRLLVQGARLTARPNPWCHLAAGMLGYDLIDFFERLPAGRPDPLEQPLFECWVPDRLVMIDHVRRHTIAIATSWGGAGSGPRYHDATRALERLVAGVTAGVEAPAAADDEPPVDLDPEAVAVDQSAAEYAAAVAKLQGHLRAGDAYQIVPSRTFSLPCPDPLAAYRRLRRRNPSPYLFCFRSDGHVLLGASPETCLRVDGAGRRVTILPIAGTAARARGPDGRIEAEADTRLEVALRLDLKESAEHLMLVDLARNDVARVSEPGSRVVTRLLAVERYAHVMHLVSEVSGRLRPGVDALEAYAATLNMGTLVGAPKVRAAELLRETEPSRRGFYGGAVGYLLDDGTLETAIVIRSALVTRGTAYVRAGAGVVLDSDPAREAVETARKARAVLEAVAGEVPSHV